VESLRWQQQQQIAGSIAGSNMTQSAADLCGGKGGRQQQQQHGNRLPELLHGPFTKLLSH
jgi:hypothetical protein